MSNAYKKKYDQNFSAERRAPVPSGARPHKGKNKRARPFAIEMQWTFRSTHDEAPWTTLKRYRTAEERDVALALNERKYASDFMKFRAA